nr:DUF397 domain-containing protein [Nocardia nova]
MDTRLEPQYWFRSTDLTRQYVAPEPWSLGDEFRNLTLSPVGVRDSKNPTGPALVFAPDEWDAFTAHLRSGTFDLA